MSDTQPEYEITVTWRDRETGEALEKTFYRATHVRTLTQDDLDTLDVSVNFTALGDPDRDGKTLIVKNLGKVPPCTCYERLTGR